MIKVLSIAALISATATASFAGNLNAGTEEQYIDPNAGYVEQTPPPKGSSLFGGSGIGVPLAIGTILTIGAIAYVINENKDDDPAPAPVD
ncbi:hypothetical protein [Sulfitobacter guttiformis]|uniref:Secreted protein n=1 Tax=Sulfitobacter guttiformis TaxID=74349 RepID=A0A420DRP5_9RHOB|nr:hypothetical protein [Sulfitobacter guttiformis]KIN74312.1 hypothetical protein Z949_3510 [Sulfitobacter guttiformis KCTC 32187]RKE96912.1 hypothetical protein C8N30_1492 [Sulfitobacter guttiformis]